MPSVRVRRCTILDPTSPHEHRSIASIFALRPPSVTVTSATETARPEPELPPTTDGLSVGLAPLHRPRASSRVTEHCMNQSLKLVKTRSCNPNAPRSLPDLRAGIVVPEGAHPHESTQPRDERGSVSSVHSGDTWEDNHHPDDIVEHLDCIDPQVATVSSLTNAANAIVIPPLSFYSRKPSVELPLLGQENDIEKEQRLEDSLDRHVNDVLKRPSKFKRTMQGVWSFLKTPLGIVTGIYGFLVVFWGAAIVLFLAKIINLHNPNTQGFWVEICSQIENGLFTVTGIGLIPWRAMDTYRIYKIWRHKRRTAKLRAAAGLPQLYDIDDLPDPAYDPNYVHVLTEEQQLDLHKQQRKFHQHQTWYRPHGTETHRAFPINTALLICCLIDGNSFFQIILCCTMWSLNRFQRPAWSTGTLIPLCCLCGIGAAILIWHGGHKTKRTKEVQEKLRQVLAMRGPTNVNTTVTNIEHATSSITGDAVPLIVVGRKEA